MCRLLLEMMHEAQPEPLAFRTELSVRLEVGVEEQMGVLRETLQGAGSDGEDFFHAAHLVAIDLRALKLFEIVPVDTGAEPLGQDLVRGGEVRPPSLACLSVLHDGGAGVSNGSSFLSFHR